jgi:group I intron endonuclease
MKKKYFLYHKESPLGLNYLGITSQDPFLYKGSGKYWKLHIKKHNLDSSDIKTTILFETFDKQELRAKGVYYSQLYNVVNSDNWANLIEETGEGVFRVKLSEEHKRKISESNKGRKLNPETIKLIASKNRGRKNTEESKKKMSLARIGKPGVKHTEETKEKLSKIKTGKLKPGVAVIHIETGEVFDSVTKAAKAYGLNKTTLTKHIKNKKEGCLFEYLDHSYSKTRKGNVGMKFSEEAKKNMSLNNGMKIKIIHIETGRIFDSITSAADFVGMKQNSLAAQLRYGRKSEFKYL